MSKHILPSVWCVATILCGCASTQLNYNTLDIASSVGDLIKQQTLYNLGKSIANPNAMPTHVAFNTGTVETTNSLTPTFTDPIGKTLAIANTVAQATATTITNAHTATHPNASTTIGASNQWKQSWVIDPVTSSLYVRPLRLVYRYVVGAIGEAELIKKFPPVKRELVGANCYRFIICKDESGLPRVNPNIVRMRNELYWRPGREPPEGAISFGVHNGYEIFATDPDTLMEFMLYVEDIIAVDPGDSKVIGVTSGGRPVIGRKQ